LEHDFPKLAAAVGQAPLIKDNPPLICHATGEGEEDLLTRARTAWAGYRESLQEDRRVLLDCYELKDVAIKVVGVGSVGTYCCVMLLMASEQDPLFLQVKEARASVLEAYAGKSICPHHGQRVVNGYHLIQAASDIFLGWAKGKFGRPRTAREPGEELEVLGQRHQGARVLERLHAGLRGHDPLAGDSQPCGSLT
jgi:hypothetical protein